MTDPVLRHLVYFDSNVFIYLIEGEPSISEPLRELFSLLPGRPGIVVTSELTLAEVLAPPSRPDAMPLHVKRRLYLNLIVSNRAIDLKAVSRGILYQTAELRSISRLRLPDAIHIATAVQSGCVFFMSADRDARKLPVGMTHLKTNEAGIRSLVSRLNA